MRRRPFGNTRRKAPVIGQGTWRLDEGDRASAVRALRRGLDLGLDHIDTAEMYGDAELMVGEAVEGRREEVLLVSKVLPGNATRAGVAAACERSLRRLATDYLDAYLLHWRGGIPLAETVQGFEDLRAAGKILWWGVSNFDVGDLDDLAKATAGAGSPGGPVCNQVLYHLEERAIEHALLARCEEAEMAVVGYSPFGHGRFPPPGSPGGEVLARIAAVHGAAPRQVALAFLTRKAPLFAIPKAASPDHAIENAGAGDLILSAGEITMIDRAFPRGARPRSLPMI
ncbi:MAG TPA: aldo/keto reductase [Caulobacteraceae bacterium]|nr:aldo/keto reductase [Caulobacteraceae bacterium]